MGRLRIESISQRTVLRDFFRVPWFVYRSDSNWVPPLLLERRQALDGKNPVFEHLNWQGWVAYRDDHPVGRITAQVDRLHQERYRDNTGFFGFIEMSDDPEVTVALFDAAESWLRDRGVRRVVGPFSMNVNQETGLLVDGFDSSPYVMMGHGRPYYGAALERCGYRSVKDVLAYEIEPGFEIPPVMAALGRRFSSLVSLRPIERKHLDRELDTLCDIFNDAWADNWGFLPFTRAEFRAVGDEIKLLIPDDFIQIAEIDGEPVAFIVLLPNINEAIADLNGRLLPFGWAKLLWRLKVRYPKTARIPLMGVRRRFQHTRLGPGLAFAVINALREPAIRNGIERVEMSWILEDNQGMRNIIETLGGRLTKRYRLYEKTIGS